MAVKAHEEVYQVLLSSAVAIEATTWLIAVDLSDTTNYKHPATKSINLLKVDVDAEKASDGAFDIKLGVVRENDATNGSADLIYVFKDEAVGNPTDSTDRYTRSIDFTTEKTPEGLDCTVGADSRLKFMRGPNSGDIAALVSTLGSLTSAAGGASLSAAVGDLVVCAEETGGTGSLDLVMKFAYTVN